MSRLLMLDGDDGSVACRLYGSLGATFPRLSDAGTLELASRSFLRMKNLTAVRGDPGRSMVGPADYLGNLEEPDRYLYTVDASSFPPVWHRRPAAEQQEEEEEPARRPFDDGLVTTVRVRWVSGKTKEIAAVQREYGVRPKDIRQSLFLKPGLLELLDSDAIALQSFDARDVDLSSFRVRLYRNDRPFRISRQPLPPEDEYRIVTYLYEPGYAARQVSEGSGLFLERHDFAQTMTPVDAHSGGFIMLARTNDQPDQLELVGVRVPHGYTLVVDPDAIHGDTTFDGFYCMGMTSNHVTMRTADTVFLKSSATRRNVAATMPDPAPAHVQRPPHIHPHVLYRQHTEDQRAQFCAAVRGQNFVFNPTSKAFWKTFFKSRSIWSN